MIRTPWRWWDRIQAIFLNLFYFNCNRPAIINQSHLTNNFCLSTQCLCFLECRKCVSRTQSTGNFPSYFWLVRRWPSPCLLKLPKLYYYRQKVKRVVLDWLLCSGPWALKHYQSLSICKIYNSHFIFEVIKFLSKIQNHSRNCQIMVIFQKSKTTLLTFCL